jgi:hypothetical protein
MRHAQLTLVVLAIVCTVWGPSAARSLEGYHPVGRSAPAAEIRVRSIECVTTDEGIEEGMEEPRRLPDVAASPLGIPVQIPACRIEPAVLSGQQPRPVQALPPSQCQVGRGEPARLPTDEMYRSATVHPIRPNAESPWSAAVARAAVRSDVAGRPGEPLGPGAFHPVPVGVGRSLHADPWSFDRGDVPAWKEASTALPTVESIRIPRMPSRAQDWATW